MEIRTNDYDDLDYDYEEVIEEPTSQDIIEETQEENDLIVEENDVQDTNDDRSVIKEFLKLAGIQDISKIKYNVGEEIQELDWDSLPSEDKLNILRDSLSQNDSDLDDSEIELLNTIRQSKMSPTEYINYVQKQGVDNYILNNSQPKYSVDDYSDEDLFLADLLTRLGEDNVSDEEALNLLETAKLNEVLFKKQVDAIRNEYKLIEDYNRQQETSLQQQQLIEKYNAFAENIENEIRGFKDVYGYDLNMDESEMEELYDFITGFDDANVSIFSKALNDPKTLVRMAWFALHGEQAINDINAYWTNEIKKYRKNTNKPKPTSKVVVKNTTKDVYDDID